MALPNVKEDVLQIILNLKKIRIKVFTEEVVKLDLEVSGIKEVTAKDIKPDSQVEIINPDLVLANVTDAAGNLKMEIFVAQGKGYETTEGREEKSKEVNYIDIDSIFSPVLNVGISVENVRIGKMTNWDKLVLTVLTDGTMTPEEAFNKSNQILIEQFSALTPENQAAGQNKKEEESAEEAEESKKEEKQKDEPAEEAEEKPKKRGRKSKAEKEKEE